MNKEIILETNRLYLRKLTPQDFDQLCLILQDEEVMVAYEHAFDDEEVHDWLNRQLQRYQQDGFGLWAVILKESEALIGQCGLTLQSCEDQEVMEVGYLFQKAYWHKGYATEAAIACKQYAFEHFHVKEVYSIIRDTNIPSQAVARRNGMKITGRLMKCYYHMVMPHLVFRVTHSEYETKKMK